MGMSTSTRSTLHYEVIPFTFEGNATTSSIETHVLLVFIGLLSYRGICLCMQFVSQNRLWIGHSSVLSTQSMQTGCWHSTSLHNLMQFGQ
jgi:hypothetical protein